MSMNYSCHFKRRKYEVVKSNCIEEKNSAILGDRI